MLIQLIKNICFNPTNVNIRNVADERKDIHKQK